MERPKFNINTEGAKDSQLEMVGGILDFLTTRGMKGSDLREAYLLALEINDDEHEASQDVKDLSDKLKGLFSQGLALNRVTDLITFQEKFENSTIEYSDLVEKLLLTEREKKVLTSIVEQQRSGTLSVFINKLGVVDELNINKEGSASKEELASNLLRFLARFAGLSGVTVQFVS
jgi:hypothetical protein